MSGKKYENQHGQCQKANSKSGEIYLLCTEQKTNSLNRQRGLATTSNKNRTAQEMWGEERNRQFTGEWKSLTLRSKLSNEVPMLTYQAARARDLPVFRTGGEGSPRTQNRRTRGQTMFQGNRSLIYQKAYTLWLSNFTSRNLPYLFTALIVWRHI